MVSNRLFDITGTGVKKTDARLPFDELLILLNSNNPEIRFECGHLMASINDHPVTGDDCEVGNVLMRIVNLHRSIEHGK